MIDRMIDMRSQGFTQAKIGLQLGVSGRTVRRHTRGVVPRLVHPGDLTPVDLLESWSHNAFALKDRLKLRLQEVDIVIKRARETVAQLDELTIQRLESDSGLRQDFWLHEVLPAAVRGSPR